MIRPALVSGTRLGSIGALSGGREEELGTTVGREEELGTTEGREEELGTTGGREEVVDGPLVAVEEEGVALKAPDLNNIMRKSKKKKKKGNYLPGPSYPHITGPGAGTGEPGMAGNPLRAASTSKSRTAAESCVGISWNWRWPGSGPIPPLVYTEGWRGGRFGRAFQYPSNLALVSLLPELKADTAFLSAWFKTFFF